MKACRICGETHQHLYAEGNRFVHAECLPPKPHWENPWEDAVPVPIEELVECAVGLGASWRDTDGSSFIMTKERMLEHWRNAGEKLDAYILPQPSGFHSMGIRYGAEGSQYLSPLGDKEKLAALLKRYQ